MLIGIVGDVHWSKHSSIVRGTSEKYSNRLQNCIDSVNFAEEVTSNCNMVVYMGDFFDSSELNANELTALKAIKWNDKHHTFLVGNHEIGLNSSEISSAHIFNMKHMKVIDSMTHLIYENILFLPYYLNENIPTVLDKWQKAKDNADSPMIVFSHNDIAGIQLGNFKTINGFNIDDIENNCGIFINGHYHNKGTLSNKIINVGNLTGQNFSEDATKYKHCVHFLDTDTLELTSQENPHAFKFYKIDLTKNDESLLNDILNSNTTNNVLTLKVNSGDEFKYRELLKNNKNIETYRVIIEPDVSSEVDIDRKLETLSINHLDEFNKYVLTKLGDSDMVLSELEQIMR